MASAMTQISETDRLLPDHPRGKRRMLRLALTFAAGGIAFGLAVGFVDFADRVAAAAQPADPHAQGIVVLTGGTSRIDEALQLLAAGRAERLLISGVNPAVTRETLAGMLSPDLQRALACCVDLDHEAQDTVGNATETREWAAREGFTSLIVVTSAYHMPRSMAELAEAMPDKTLIPYPVRNPELHLASWWQDSDTVGLLMREYGKFLFAEARRMLALKPANAATTRG
jgi:uncharacterized SAM-binding protein YcdF (DUF218 family)